MIFMIRQILTYVCLTMLTSILNAQADEYFSFLNQDSLLKRHQVKSITFYDTSSEDEMNVVKKYNLDLKGRLRKVQECYIDEWDTSRNSKTHYYAKTRLVKTMSLGNYDEKDLIDTVLTTYYYYKDGRLRKSISTSSFSSRIDTCAYTYFSSAGRLIWRKIDLDGVDSFFYYVGVNLIRERKTSGQLEEIMDQNGHVYYQEKGYQSLIDIDGNPYDWEIVQFIYTNNKISQIINLWRNPESEVESTPETWSFFYNDSGLVFKIEREQVRKNDDDELKKETTQYFLRYEFY